MRCVQHDVITCSQCGYELTGLGRQGRCPECGRYFDQFSREGVDQPPGRTDRTRLWLDKHLRTTVLALVGGLMLIILAGFVLLAGVALTRTGPLLGVLVLAWLLILLASYIEER